MKMGSFLNKPIRQKLIFVIMLTTSISLFIVSLAFIIYEVFAFRMTMAKELSLQAELVAESSKTALLTKDRTKAQAILLALKNQTNIVSAQLYTDLGQVFASFEREKNKNLGLLSEGIYFNDDRISFYSNLRENGQLIGTIALQSNLQKLYDRLFIYLRILIVVMLFTFLLALQISAGLQRFISNPILYLVQIVKQISEKEDLSIRAEKRTDDEIGLLTDAFNRMLTQLEEAKKRLVYEAYYDRLTALPNRALLNDRLDQLIKRNKRNPNYKFAVLFIDLDRFKLINDSLGHMTGDQLLVQFSQRLKKILRGVDTVSRLGGDEFVILLEEIKKDKEVILVSQRIMKALETPFNLNDQKVFMTASVGITINRPDYTQPSDFLRDADNAMYQAKTKGKACYQIFDSTMHTKTKALLDLEMDLRLAIERKEFVVYYQPIVRLSDHKIMHLEALVRWQHPKRGLLLPGEFISLAEETNLILPLGEFVLNSVCEHHREWINQNHAPIEIMVNISVKQFKQKNFVNNLRKILKETQMNPANLGLEITESLAMEEFDFSVKLIHEIRQLGSRIALDDFGVGYASLNNLKLLPINTIKIDGSFIQSIHQDPHNDAIVEAVIALAHKLNLKVVAEGIEQPYQMDFLNLHGCDEAQGFLISYPLSNEEIEKLFQTGQLSNRIITEI